MLKIPVAEAERIASLTRARQSGVTIVDLVGRLGAYPSTSALGAAAVGPHGMIPARRSDRLPQKLDLLDSL